MLSAVSAIAGFASANDPLNPAPMDILIGDAKQNKVVSLRKDLEGFMLNPTELAVDRKLTWQPQRANGSGTKESGGNAVTYAGGEDSMKVTFMIDAAEKSKVNLARDMFTIYRAAGASEYPGKAGGEELKVTRGPVVKVLWGTFMFTGVMDDLNMKCTLFDHAGLFKRVVVSMSLKGSAFYDGDPMTYLTEGIQKAKFKEPEKGSGGLLGSLF